MREFEVDQLADVVIGRQFLRRLHRTFNDCGPRLLSCHLLRRRLGSLRLDTPRFDPGHPQKLRDVLPVFTAGLTEVAQRPNEITDKYASGPAHEGEGS